MSGRPPMPRRGRPRELPVARRDPARASAAPAGPRPRREPPGDGTAPEGRAAAPGFRPGAGRPPGPAASAGQTGPAPEHRRWPTGRPHGPAGLAGRSRQKRHRIPARSSRGQRRDQAGHTPRARTDPPARTGPPDRSPPPTRRGLAHRKRRPGRRPEARTGRRAPALHPAHRARAGSTGPCPALLRRRTEAAASADWASLRRPTSRAKTTTPIRAGQAGPANPASPRRPACRRHRARSTSRAGLARSAESAVPAHRDRSTDAAGLAHPADPLCLARLTDRAGPAQAAERPGAGLARSAGLAGSADRADPMAPGSADRDGSTGRAGSVGRKPPAGPRAWEPAHRHLADLPERIRLPRPRRAG